jgi:uroporphyrinogen-III synthase/uroporphyrinogen III methyltransferase/synthase
MAELGVPSGELSSRSLAAVGPATSARLAAGLRPPDLAAAEASGEGLARALAGLVGGKRVLLPRAAEGRPELFAGLSGAGAEVTTVEAYRTLPVPRERLLPLAGWIERGEVDAVAFASPSAVRAVAAALLALRPKLRHALLAAIGPTTAAALCEAGLPVGVVAAHPTGAELADAIAAALGPR